MNLTEVEIQKFYKLWYAMVWGINEKHKVIPHFKKPKYGTRVSVSIEEFMKVRDMMWENPKWIDEFLVENDKGQFTVQELDIMMKWRKYFIKGQFLVVKHLSKYTVLMTFSDEQPIYLYATHGISDPLEYALPYPVPFAVNLVLLPWNDKIIYDSLATASNVSFSAGLRSSVNEGYNQIKAKYGIIKDLQAGDPVERLPKKKKREASIDVNAIDESIPTPAKVPKLMIEKYNEIAEIITQFSKEKLNEEYQELCLKVLAKLCRKRPSPLLKGKIDTWACGIVYAIGSNNFIFDKSQGINMTATEIAQWFGLSKSTAGSKASEISRILRISITNAEFVLKSMMDSNPAIWLFEINGFIMDIRKAPYDTQKEAYERGWIPYIPDDKE